MYFLYEFMFLRFPDRLFKSMNAAPCNLLGSKTSNALIFYRVSPKGYLNFFVRCQFWSLCVFLIAFGSKFDMKTLHGFARVKLYNPGL